MTRDGMPSFPLGVWGTVRSAPERGSIERVQVVRAVGRGYLLLMLENGREYDTWVETVEELEADLRALAVEWDEGTPRP